jgi:hypothetical protein
MANGAFKNGKVRNISITGSTVYTVPATKESCIHAIYITNTYGLEDLFINLEVIASDGVTSFKVAYLLPVPKNQTLVFERPINLMSNEALKATASRANSIDIVASILEITP